MQCFLLAGSCSASSFRSATSFWAALRMISLLRIIFKATSDDPPTAAGPALSCHHQSASSSPARGGKKKKEGKKQKSCKRNSKSSRFRRMGECSSVLRRRGAGGGICICDHLHITSATYFFSMRFNSTIYFVRGKSMHATKHKGESMLVVEVKNNLRILYHTAAHSGGTHQVGCT